jgi:rod shape-determining protein MreB
MLVITKIGLDLGYANITLTNVTAEVYREPSVVLVDKNTRRVISVGNRAALSGDEQNNEMGILVRPFKNGLLYSSDMTDEIIKHAISAIPNADKIRCVVSLPSDFLTKQENEVFKMLSNAGVSESFSVNPAVAALIGSGYSPMISAVSINIGAAFTEIAVLHKGEILFTSREQIGGEDFDTAVKQYIFEQGDMTVSLLVARAIKERLGAVWQGRESASIDIEGTLSLTGNRVKMSVSTEDIVGVFEKPLQKLLLTVANAIKKIPLDCVKDVFENGIILSGGGAELYGIDSIMSKVLGIQVTKAVSPIDSVAKGLSRINTFIPVKLRLNGKNITSQIAKFYETKRTQAKK